MSEKLILNVQRCFVLMCGQRTPIHPSLRPLLTLSGLFFYLLLVWKENTKSVFDLLLLHHYPVFLWSRTFSNGDTSTIELSLPAEGGSCTPTCWLFIPAGRSWTPPFGNRPWIIEAPPAGDGGVEVGWETATITGVWCSSNARVKASVLVPFKMSNETES